MTATIEQGGRRGGQGMERGPSPRARAVRVSLYGGLSSLMPERPTIVHAPRDATVGWVVGELERTLGPRFAEGVLQSPGEKRGVCRIFLDGLPVDLGDRLPPGEADTNLELIVLTAIEGG